MGRLRTCLAERPRVALSSLRPVLVPSCAGTSATSNKRNKQNEMPMRHRKYSMCRIISPTDLNPQEKYGSLGWPGRRMRFADDGEPILPIAFPVAAIRNHF